METKNGTPPAALAAHQSRIHVQYSFPGTINGMPAEVIIEPVPDGAAVSVLGMQWVGSGYRNKEYCCKTVILDRFMLCEDGIGLIKSYRRIPGISGDYVVKDCEDARDAVSELAHVKLKGAGLNLVAVVRGLFFSRWHGYPAAFYASMRGDWHDGGRFGGRFEAFCEALLLLPRDAGDIDACEAFIAHALHGNGLAGCKGVRRALARHPEVGACMAVYPFLAQVSDPNILCSFIDSPNVFNALIMLVMKDKGTLDGILGCFAGAYGINDVLDGLLDESFVRDVCLIGRYVQSPEGVDDVCPCVCSCIVKLRDGGLGIKDAAHVIGSLGCEGDGCRYTLLQKSHERRIGEYRFLLPKDKRDLRIAGWLMGNFLGMYKHQSTWERSTVYLVHGEADERPRAAVEVNFEERRVITAELSHVRDLDEDPGMKMAVDEFSKGLQRSTLEELELSFEDALSEALES